MDTFMNHPDDPNGQFDYDSMPDADEYWAKYGDFNEFDKDYDEWLGNQYEQHGYGDWS